MPSRRHSQRPIDGFTLRPIRKGQAVWFDKQPYAKSTMRNVGFVPHTMLPMTRSQRRRAGIRERPKATIFVQTVHDPRQPKYIFTEFHNTSTAHAFNERYGGVNNNLTVIDYYYSNDPSDLNNPRMRFNRLKTVVNHPRNVALEINENYENFVPR